MFQERADNLWANHPAAGKAGLAFQLAIGHTWPSLRKRVKSTSVILGTWLGTWLCLIAISAKCGGLRVSFLNDDEALEETLSFLHAAGCVQYGVESFRL